MRHWRGGHSGLEVKGRGLRSSDRCHRRLLRRSRLLVTPTPTCRSKMLLQRIVGVDVVRNAVGVLQGCQRVLPPGPTNQYLQGTTISTPSSRPLDFYGTCSKHYAFAQDIYLLPLAQSAFLSLCSGVSKIPMRMTLVARNLRIGRHRWCESESAPSPVFDRHIARETTLRDCSCLKENLQPLSGFLMASRDLDGWPGSDDWPPIPGLSGAQPAMPCRELRP